MPAYSVPIPFSFVGGHVALDFANTGPSDERIGTYGRFLEWAAEAGLPVDVRLLERRAWVDPGAADRALAAAHELRAQLQELFLARAERGAVPRTLVDDLNARLADSLARLELQERAGRRTRFAWGVRHDRGLDAPLHWLVWEAAGLLAMNERIKKCANPPCTWVFIDRSRRGNRRWCDMAVCGSRHKARAYYRRKKQTSRRARRAIAPGH